jgi:hypothetical protein
MSNVQPRRENITFPVSRVIGGSLYKPRTTDYDGKQLVVKTGNNAGQPRVDFNFGVAIPKAGEQHWSQTPWGAKIWAIGHEVFGPAAQRPDFAWKISDGDSTIPNKRNKIPRDQEGYAGHWIVWFSSGVPPQIFQNGGSERIDQEGYVKCGYYVEVFGECADNRPSQSPGVYLNHRFVNFRAFGPEIMQGPDVSEAGFGQSPLPAGASMTPIPSSGTVPPGVPTAAAPIPSTPAYMPAAAAPPANVPYSPPAAAGVGNGYAPPVAPPPQQIGVMPNPAILNAPVAPPPANVPPPPAARQMTALAQGAPYQQFIQNGWTDAQLIQNGYMIG